MEKSSKLAKAIARTVLDHPFFATLLLDMRLREDRGTKTACTNGREIRYNPAFINSLNVDQIVFVLAHLVMHVAHHHPLRRSARNLRRFNKAGDYAINGILKEAGLSMLPGALYKKEFDNLAAEQIYEQLPASSSNRDDNGKGSGEDENDDPGGCGGFEDAKDEHGNSLSKAERQHEEARVTLAIQRAAQAAKKASEDHKAAIEASLSKAGMMISYAGAEGFAQFLRSQNEYWTKTVPGLHLKM